MSRITGKAKRFNGAAIDYVSVFEWSNGSQIGKVVPDVLGNWSFNYADAMDVGITYVADGCEPITHGKYPLALDWSPSMLFTGQQGCWYDPSDITTLFQDVSGTIPVTQDGQSVSLMLDKSGRGNNMIQPVATARPIYRSCGRLKWLYFDGVDDHMYLPSVRFSTPALLSVSFILLNFTSDFAAIKGVGVLSGSIGLGYFVGRTPELAYSQLRTASDASQLEIPRPNSAHVATIDGGASNHNLYTNQNNTATAAHTLGALTFNQDLAIGARPSALGTNHYSNMKYFGSALIDGAVSSENRIKLIDYLAARSGNNT